MSMRPQIRKVPEPKAGAEDKTFAIVGDLMQRPAVTTVMHASVEHVRKILRKHHFHALPVINGEGEAAGIVTTADLLDDVSDSTPIREIMSRDVLTVPQYEDPSIAARIMRNHSVHHLVVTHEKKVVGVLSSFDLLRLVEGHSFVSKQNSTRPRGRGGRKQEES